MIKSRPLYVPFKLDLTGRVHLIVTAQPTLPEEADLALANIETWTVQTIAPGVQAPAAQNIRAYRSIAEMLTHLTHRLSRETAGFRLYAVGSEAFIWDVYNLGCAAGMDASEIHLTQSGPQIRRVYCTHCRTLIEDVARTIVPCPACSAVLFVRDHFSRRLAAFMGVKVDAEIPGEIPAPEVFTS